MKFIVIFKKLLNTHWYVGHVEGQKSGIADSLSSNLSDGRSVDKCVYINNYRAHLFGNSLIVPKELWHFTFMVWQWSFLKDEV